MATFITVTSSPGSQTAAAYRNSGFLAQPPPLFAAVGAATRHGAQR